MAWIGKQYTKLKLRNVFYFFITAFLSSCKSGYVRENGQWVWISYDESVGRRVTMIDSVDNETFKVLKNKNYAVDKNSVFYTNRRIRGCLKL